MKNRRSRRAGTPACVDGSSACDRQKYADASWSMVEIEATASGSSTFSSTTTFALAAMTNGMTCAASAAPPAITPASRPCRRR